MYYCHHCRNELELDKGKAGFRAECPHCNRALHCCLNCRFHAPGKNNDCAETKADRVVDKDRQNFCEYLEFRDSPVPPASGSDEKEKAKAAAEALFKK